MSVSHQRARRFGFGATILALLTTMLAAWGGSTASASSSLSGQTIHVLLAKDPQADFIVKELATFTKQTGINVVVEQYPESVYHAKLSVVAAARSSQYDGWAIEPVVDLYTETSAGWIQPIDNYLRHDVANDYDYAGIFSSARQASTQHGHTWGVPFVMDVQLFYYRKDIFSTLHLSVPKTFGQWLAVAKNLQQELPTHGYSGVYPVALRASAMEGNAMLATFLYSEGGQWFKNGKFDLTSPPSIRAVQFFAQLMKYAPPGEPTFGWEQVVPLFTAGKLAMFSDDAAFNTDLTAPSSKVRGKIGYAEVPGGPAGPKPWLLSWDLVMNKYSQHEDAMWTFMEWASSPEQAVRFQQTGGNSWRPAAWTNPQARRYAATHGLAAFDAAFFESLPDGLPQWVPPMAQALQFRKVYGTALDNVLAGMDPKQAMAQADDQGDALLHQP